MSRIGRAPIPVPPKVQVNWDDGNLVSVKGPKGELSYQIDPELSLKLEDGTLTVSRPSDSKEQKAKHGLYRSLVNNMVVGVTNGYTKQLEIHGVGYRAAKVGENLVILVGYSHPVEVQPPTMELIQPPRRRRSVSMALINNWWARSPRVSVESVSRSPIKVKAFATRARQFAVKLVKLVKLAARKSKDRGDTERTRTDD